jgi:hypothetical protein
MEIVHAITTLRWLFANFLIFTEANEEACAISIIWTFVPFGVWVCRGIIAVKFFIWFKKMHRG